MDLFKKNAYKEYLIQSLDIVVDAKILEPKSEDNLWDIILKIKIDTTIFHYPYKVNSLETIKYSYFWDEVKLTLHLYDKMFVNIQQTSYNPNFFIDLYIGRYLFITSDRSYIPYYDYYDRVNLLIQNNRTSIDKLNTLINIDIIPFDNEDLI